jgi:hypothetical protein
MEYTGSGYTTSSAPFDSLATAAKGALSDRTQYKMLSHAANLQHEHSMHRDALNHQRNLQTTVLSGMLGVVRDQFNNEHAASESSLARRHDTAKTKLEHKNQFGDLSAIEGVERLAANKNIDHAAIGGVSVKRKVAATRIKPVQAQPPKSNLILP